MLTVCTINAGDYLGRGVEYTNILFDSVRRNLSDTFPGKFVVFTDSIGAYAEGIEVRPLPVIELTGWWTKLSLFKSGTFADGERVLFMDLDTVLTGRLDEIASYDGPFCILRDFFRPNGWQSSVMAWEAGRVNFIWDDWNTAGRPTPSGGDQTIIEGSMGPEDADLWQDLFPESFVSFKVSGGALPQKASVVVFHGEPRPHEVITGWVPQVWKVGGMTRADLDVICNTERELIHANILTNIKADVQWFDFDWRRNLDQVCIVGGAPSLATKIDELKWRRTQGHEIWATNGTHDYLISKGIIPDAMFILDARPENQRFVRYPHVIPYYYVASQCDPSVLESLKGHNVVLFHNATDGAYDLLAPYADKPVHLLGGGTTVGMKAALVAELMGATAIHLYGMDSCYSDDQHHAYPQALNDNERILDVIYGERSFKCAPWMVTQATDFIEFAQRYLGTLTVAGDGLLAHIARCGIPECAADERAREILSRLPSGPVLGAEIGVFAGELSARLLQRDDLSLIMVDSWAASDAGAYDESGDFHDSLTQEQQDAYAKLTANKTLFADPRGRIIRKPSDLAARDVQDVSLDFVFIDADHTYEGCRRDLYAWERKVKPGGLLSGHDYNHPDFPNWGVRRAVDEFCANYGFSLELGDNFTWFIRMP